MNVLVADLDEARARLGQQLARDEQPVAQVGQVGVDPEFPGVAERLDLLGLARSVLELAVLDVAIARGHLPVRAELDAVGRVDVDHLDLAAQLLPLGERRHHLKGVAEDHPVRPVGVVLVEVDLVELVEAVEGVEERQLGLVLGTLGGAAEVLDQDPGVDLLLDVDRRRVGDQVVVVPVDVVGRRVLAPPDQLRVEALVAGVADLADLLDRGVDELVRVGGRDVGPLVAVRDRVDRGRALGGCLRATSAPIASQLVEVEQVGVADDRRVVVQQPGSPRRAGP